MTDRTEDPMMSDTDDAAREAMRQGFEAAADQMGIPELIAIVRDLAEHQGPVGWDAHGRPALCLICKSPGPGLASPEAHQPFCAWRRSREWIVSTFGAR